MAASGEEFFKQRLEKDLAELKKMIESHFEQRKELGNIFKLPKNSGQ